MNNKKKQVKTILLLAGSLLVGLFALQGCKKSEPTEPAEPEGAVSATILQKTCPVMGSPINKDIFTEYKGKKVYFCMPACKEKFEANPEEYIAKLPQFKE